MLFQNAGPMTDVTRGVGLADQRQRVGEQRIPGRVHLAIGFVEDLEHHRGGAAL
jgi:hypothetical protein